MGRYGRIIVILILLTGIGFLGLSCKKQEKAMNLISSNFQNGQELPKKYSCDGEGVAPNLQWSGFPAETKSFALIFEDPDAPAGTFVHWLVVNIPTMITSAEEGGVDISEGTAITNDGGSTAYIPPCPPSGSHRYIFKVFALNIEKLDGITKDNFQEKIKPYIIDQAELMGRYQHK